MAYIDFYNFSISFAFRFYFKVGEKYILLNPLLAAIS